MMYPIAIGAIGLERYGLAVYILSWVSILRVIVRYGVEIFGVDRLVKLKEDAIAVDSFICATIVLQIIIYLFGLLLFALIMFFVDLDYESLMILSIYLLYPLSDVLLGQWVYHAKSRFFSIAILQVTASLISVGLVFFLISDGQDLLIFVACQVIPFFIVSIKSFTSLIKDNNLRFSKVNLMQLLFVMKTGWGFLVSRFSATCILELPTVFLGTTGSLTQVSYWDLIRKLIEVLKLPNSVINTVIFPLASEGIEKKYIWIILLIRIIIAFSLITLSFLYMPLFVSWFVGQEMLSAMPYLVIFSPILILTAISYFIGHTVLVTAGYGREFNKSTNFAALILAITLFVNLWLGNHGIYDVIYCILIVEFLVCFWRLNFSWKNNLI